MRGTTLVELMVVLVILGTMAGVSAFAAASLRPPAALEQRGVLFQARASAIRSGKAVAVTLNDGSPVLFLPDGSAIGAGVDRFTGEVADAPR